MKPRDHCNAALYVRVGTDTGPNEAPPCSPDRHTHTGTHSHPCLRTEMHRLTLAHTPAHQHYTTNCTYPRTPAPTHTRTSVDTHTHVPQTARHTPVYTQTRVLTHTGSTVHTRTVYIRTCWAVHLHTMHIPHTLVDTCMVRHPFRHRLGTARCRLGGEDLGTDNQSSHLQLQRGRGGASLRNLPSPIP